MVWVAGPTTDSIISAGTALLVAFVSASVAVIVAVLQQRAHKKDQESAAEQYRVQAEELRDRMAANYEQQITYLRNELRREQGRNRRGTVADD